MGRGSAWSDRELADLAKALNKTSQDPIVGTDQTGAEFYTKIFENFCAMDPADADPKRYKAREVRPTRAKWEAVLREVNSFRAVLTHARALRLTGNHTEDNFQSICIAKHLRKRDTISIDAKDYPHSRWPLHLAFRILRFIPKFAGDVESTRVTTPDWNIINNGGQDDGSEDDYGLDGFESSAQPQSGPTPETEERSSADGTTTRKRKGEERGGFSGSKRAKMDAVAVRQSEKSIKNGHAIAEAMKKKKNLLSERNDIQLFNLSEYVTEQDKRDREKFMLLSRQRHIRLLEEEIKQTPSAPFPLAETPPATATPEVALHPSQPQSGSMTSIQPTAYTNSRPPTPPSGTSTPSPPRLPRLPPSPLRRQSVILRLPIQAPEATRKKEE